MSRWKLGRGRASGGITEADVTKSVRAMLKLLRVPHFKNFATLGSKRGVSDIIGVLPPTGRALFLELKAPGKAPTPDQRTFLVEMASAGAVAFWADNVRDVIVRLADEDYGPAQATAAQMRGSSLTGPRPAPLAAVSGPSVATISPTLGAQDQDAGGEPQT